MKKQWLFVFVFLAIVSFISLVSADVIIPKTLNPVPGGVSLSPIIILMLVFVSFIFEMIVIFLFLGKRVKWWKIIFFTFIINLITVSIANLLFDGSIGAFIIIELAVILVESLWINIVFKQKYDRALLISAVANVITAFIGTLNFLWWIFVNLF